MTTAQHGPTVLILTQDFDPTADPVVTGLRDRGAEVVRVDLSYFPQRMTLTSTDLGTGGERSVLRHRDREVDLGALAGVWYRRPTTFAFDDTMGEAERQFARNEAVHGVGGILRATDCVWVNRPDLDGTAELKPYHVKLAKRLGMRTPRTLMTNDPGEVAAMLDAVDGPVVYKALTGGVVHYPGAFPGGLLTTVVGDELREHLSRVRHTICTFQEYVEKAYEIRLTIVGNTYFPVVISSQSEDETHVDWRGAEQLPYGDFVPLPEHVVAFSQRLMEQLGLVYGALDFIVTPDGEYVFLEVNPNGQFIWMEHDLGLPMGATMAELLMAGGEFRRGDVTQVKY